MDLPPDFRELLAEFARDAVDVVVIGGYADADDLIANKRAAGRPQDLIDVALLERVRSRGGGE